MIKIDGLKVAGLYLQLKNAESEMDSAMVDLLSGIESYLYDRLSIEEMENLEKLYKAGDRELAKKI